MLAAACTYLLLLPIGPWLHSHGTSVTRIAATAALGWQWPLLLPLWVAALLILNRQFPTRRIP